MKLILKKSGILIKENYNSDTEKLETEDVTNTSPGHLFDVCELEDGVTLRDVFLLLQKNIDIYNMIIGNWVDEVVDEGLNNKDKENKKDNEVEYLELYWFLDHHKYSNTSEEMYGMLFPNFHGVGYESKEDKEDIKKGEITSYAVEFTPTYELINCPIRLKEEMAFIETDYSKKDGTPWVERNYKKCHFTLGHILYGIIWELSFCGSPKERDEQSSKINKSIEEIKDGTAKMIPFDLNRLKNPETEE